VQLSRPAQGIGVALAVGVLRSRHRLVLQPVLRLLSQPGPGSHPAMGSARNHQHCPGAQGCALLAPPWQGLTRVGYADPCQGVSSGAMGQVFLASVP
jgi:hypothetical protein